MTRNVSLFTRATRNASLLLSLLTWGCCSQTSASEQQPADDDGKMFTLKNITSEARTHTETRDLQVYNLSHIYLLIIA
jgi:hypothetical protein